MQQNGQFNIPIIIAVQYVNLFNLLASLFSAFPISYFGQRKALLGGQFAMVAFLGGIVIASLVNNGLLVIAFIILFIGAF